MRFSTPMTLLAFATTAFGLSGEATYYGGNLGGGACSFSTYTLPAGIYGTALSDSNWDNAAHCGACVKVTGPSGNSIVAMIVDECPGCGTNHLDLFPDAFAKLADPSKGVISTTWSYVACPIVSPLEVHNKDGVSPYWFSMQVVNANKEVAKLEVSTDAGNTWSATARQSYNYFEKSTGFGTSSVMVKVTSIDGDLVILSPVAVSPNKVVQADINFISEVGPGSVSSSVPAVVAAPPSSSPSRSSAPSPSVETAVIPATTPAAVAASPVVTPAVQDTPSVSSRTPEAAVGKASPSTSKAAAATTPAPAVSAAVLAESSTTPTTSSSTLAAIPAAEINATPSAEAKASPADDSTTTSSSTTTATTTVTIPAYSASSKLSAYSNPSAQAPYPTTFKAVPTAVTVTLNACPSSSSPAAGVASSTLQIIASPAPSSVSPSASPAASLVPYTGAASITGASYALFLSISTIAITALM